MSINHQARWQRPASASAVAAHGWRARLPLLGAAGFAALSLALLFAQHWAPEALNQARLRAAGHVLALADTLAAPIDALDRAHATLNDWSRAVDRNRELEIELRELRRQRAALQALRSENEQLRALMPIAPVPPRFFIIARVVGLSGGAQQQSVWINAGSEQGVAVNMAVMAPNGLIGRVLEAGPATSRVLLITDGLSRLPVATADSRLQAIATGDHSGLPQLRYLPARTEPGAGELVSTSGDGALLPAGLPVGLTERDDTQWRVRPLADLARLDMVSVVDFDWRGKR